MENASSRKANAENFITKFARYYTPAVVIAAVLLAVILHCSLASIPWTFGVNGYAVHLHFGYFLSLRTGYFYSFGFLDELAVHPNGRACEG